MASPTTESSCTARVHHWHTIERHTWGSAENGGTRTQIDRCCFCRARRRVELLGGQPSEDCGPHAPKDWVVARVVLL